MSDDGHVSGAVTFSQTRLTFGKDDVGRPMPLGLETAAVAKPGARMHANQRSGVRQAQFAGKAPFAVEPIDLPDNADGSPFDAAVALVVVDECVDLSRHGESGLRLLAQGGLIGFDDEQIVGALVIDHLRDLCVGGDGVNGHERAFQACAFGKTIGQDRKGLERVALRRDFSPNLAKAGLMAAPNQRQPAQNHAFRNPLTPVIPSAGRWDGEAERLPWPGKAAMGHAARARSSAG